MEYFRITRCLGDVYSYKLKDYITLVESELLTKRELDNYYRRGYNIPVNALERVYTPQKNVYICFGVRFAIDVKKVKTEDK